LCSTFCWTAVRRKQKRTYRWPQDNRLATAESQLQVRLPNEPRLSTVKDQFPDGREPYRKATAPNVDLPFDWGSLPSTYRAGAVALQRYTVRQTLPITTITSINANIRVNSLAYLKMSNQLSSAMSFL
jgi:hypothetical protein